MPRWGARRQLRCLQARPKKTPANPACAAGNQKLLVVFACNLPFFLSILPGGRFGSRQIEVACAVRERPPGAMGGLQGSNLAEIAERLVADSTASARVPEVPTRPSAFGLTLLAQEALAWRRALISALNATESRCAGRAPVTTG